MFTEGVFNVLRVAFTYIAYPLVILGVFAVILWRMKTLFEEHGACGLMPWRLAVAAVLPVTVLTFVLVGELPGTALLIPGADEWLLQVVAGSGVSLASLEGSLHVSGSKRALSFVLYLSALASGLLYVVMQGALATFQPAVFAVVVVGGLHFVFREAV